MENKVINFQNEEFGFVRAVVIDEEPWFVGKDVATILGYSDTFGALKKHVDGDDKQNCQNDSFETPRGMTVINESGLYSLILSSKLPSAKKFKKWVTSEVLPTIRKTGGYINNADLMVNTYFSDLSSDQKGLVRGLLTNISALQNKNKALSNENDLLAQKNLEWADRSLINSLVRSYACSIGNNFGKAWNDFKKRVTV